MAEALRSLLAGLHALGLAPDVHGQPGWPFARRLATETLAIDAGLERQLAIALAASAAALVLLVVGAAHRRGRWAAWLAALGFAVLAPWPPASVLWTDAVPTSFHRSPTGFSAASIDRGLALFAAHCAECHGADGRGEVPKAASLPVWPPRLDGELLWRRPEGETFWRIAHGLRDRHGALSMPGFGDSLDDAAVWSLVDGMKALAVGRNLQREGRWSRPIPAPEAMVDCGDDLGPRPLAAFRGQRLRIVDGLDPAEDPRLVTIALAPSSAGCTIADPAARRAYAEMAGLGTDAVAGSQWIVDRDGWLRAFAPANSAGWSAASLVCRSTADRRLAGTDGLGALIAAIDADPVTADGTGAAHRR